MHRFIVLVFQTLLAVGFFSCSVFPPSRSTHLKRQQFHQKADLFFFLLPAGALLTGGCDLPDGSFTAGASGSSGSLECALLESNAFSATCLFASSASLSAIILREQSLDLIYCKRGEADFCWLSYYSCIHSMSRINCQNDVEKQKICLVTTSSLPYAMQKMYELPLQWAGLRCQERSELRVL